MTTKNFDLLDRLLTIAKQTRNRVPLEKREITGLEWNQQTWLIPSSAIQVGDSIMAEGACGTAGCMAGNAVLLAGAVTVGEGEEWDSAGNCIKRSKRDVSTYEVEYEGKIYTISALATELLGLDNREADRLFEAYNTLEDLERIIEDWKRQELFAA